MSAFTPFSFTEAQRWGLVAIYGDSTKSDREANAAKIAANFELPESERLQTSELGLVDIPTIEQWFIDYVRSQANAMAAIVDQRADEQSVYVGRTLRENHPQLLNQLKTQMGVPDVIPPEVQSAFLETT